MACVASRVFMEHCRTAASTLLRERTGMVHVRYMHAGGSKSQCPLDYGGGQWYDCGDARSRLLEMLPDDEDDVLNGDYSQALTKVVRQVWLDVIAQLRVLIQVRGYPESAPSSLRLCDRGARAITRRAAYGARFRPRLEPRSTAL